MKKFFDKKYSVQFWSTDPKCGWSDTTYTNHPEQRIAKFRRSRERKRKGLPLGHKRIDGLPDHVQVVWIVSKVVSRGSE